MKNTDSRKQLEQAVANGKMSWGIYTQSSNSNDVNLKGIAVDNQRNQVRNLT